MNAIERIRNIKKFLKERGQAQVHTLSNLLGVSEVTVRRDLERLEKDGWLTRTHGGAVINRKETPDPLIELKNIRNFFADFQLDEVDLQLYKGEVHVLIGENGSGKSTLMKLIAGWFPPDSGVILYRGEPIRYQSIYEAQKNGIIYLHQDVQSFDNLIVAENVFFGRIPAFLGVRLFVDLQRMLAECQLLFAELRIPIDPSALLGNLGYAERQLVAEMNRKDATKDRILDFATDEG